MTFRRGIHLVSFRKDSDRKGAKICTAKVQKRARIMEKKSAVLSARFALVGFFRDMCLATILDKAVWIPADDREMHRA